MATTWRAQRSDDGRDVALKIPHESGDPQLSAFCVKASSAKPCITR